MRTLSKIFTAALFVLGICMSANAEADTPQPQKVVEVGVRDNLPSTFVHRNDGKFNGFFDEDIDSICFSNFDEDFNYYPYPVSQYVYARDSLYVIPLAAVDSISLQRLPITFQPDVLIIDDVVETFIETFDDNSITFKFGTPARYLPSEGMMLYAEGGEDSMFIDGIAGRVTNVVKMNNGYRCELNWEVTPADIYSSYVSMGETDIVNYEEGSMKVRYRTNQPRNSSIDAVEKLKDFIKGLGKNVSASFVPKFSGDINGDGFDIAFVFTVNYHKEKDKKAPEKQNVREKPEAEAYGDITGEFGPFLRLIAKYESDVNGDENQAKLTCGMMFGIGCTLNGKVSASLKLLDPDKGGQKIDFDATPGIPIAGTPVKLKVDIFRPFIELEGSAQLDMALKGLIGPKLVIDIDYSKSGFFNKLTLNKKESGLEHKFEGHAVLSVSGEVSAGLAPRMQIYAVSKKILAVTFEGRLGLVFKGTASCDPARILYGDLDTPEKFDYDLRSDYPRAYNDYLYNSKSNGLLLCPRIGQKIKVDFLSGIFDSGVIMDVSNDITSTNDLPLLGQFLPYKPTSIDLTVMPRFDDLSLEYVSSENGINSYLFSYTAYERCMLSTPLGAAICCRETGEVKIMHTGLEYNKFTQSKQEAAFYVELEVGKHYVLYPAIKPFSNWIFAAPYIIYAANNLLVTGKPKDITEKSVSIVGNRVDGSFGYLDQYKFGFGVLCIDAGTVGAADLSQDEMETVFANNPGETIATWVSDDEARNLVLGKKTEFDINIKGLKEGHKYYYAPFIENKETSNGDIRKIEALGKVSSFETLGNALSIWVDPKPIVGKDFISVKGSISWNSKSDIKKEDLEVSIYVARVGELYHKISGKDIAKEIVNGEIFKTYVIGLATDKAYEYYLEVKYKGRVEESEHVHVKTDEKLWYEVDWDNMIKYFAGGFESSTSNSATFSLQADWEYVSVAESEVAIGVLLVRDKATKDIDDSDNRMYLKNKSSVKYWTKNNSGIDEKHNGYTQNRNEAVTLTVKGLKSEDKNYVYFYRPFVAIHNKLTETMYESPSLDFMGFSDFIELDGKAYGILYGPIGKFNTKGKNYKPTEEDMGQISRPKNVKGIIYVGTTNTSIKHANTGIIASHNRKAVEGGDKSFFIRCKKNVSTKNAPRLSRGPGDDDDVIDFTDDDSYDESDPFDEVLMLPELSSFKPHETIYLRSYTVNEDGLEVMSDVIEVNYDDLIDPNTLGEEITDESNCEKTPGVAVDLGLPSGTLWSSTNLGAANVDDYGDYFAWGEIEDTRGNYTVDHYKLPFDKDLQSAYNISNTNNDAAHKLLGNGWYIPNETQFKELIDQCTWTWSMLDGVSGYLVTGPNGNSIFMPAAGNMYNCSVYSNGSGGCYWTSECHSFTKNAEDQNSYKDNMGEAEYVEFLLNREAMRLHFETNSVSMEGGNCYFGRSIRPVKNPVQE